jgi:L-alanine-DL-glutamate epimerase-like enolase superfamily enzyme
LKIKTINLYHVKGRHWPRFPWIFLEIETDAGITGIGESLCYRSSGVYESLRNLRNRLKGRDPSQVTVLTEELLRSGMNTSAISGVEMALWDILGKSLKAPIHTLLGGNCRDKVDVYVDGFFRGADYVEEEYVQKALEAVAHGYFALKMDVDDPIPSGQSINRTITPKDMMHTVKMVQAVRNAVGSTIKLAIDCHGAFNATSAQELCHRLEPFDLMWVEDPVPQNNLKAMAKVTRNSAIPICTGELLRTRFEFRELFEREAADFIMPDIARTGGIAELLRISSYADTHYIPVAPHNMVGPIATMASVHACASIPNFAILEFQLGDVDWRDNILTQPIPILNGQITVPRTPGLGIELQHTTLNNHLVPESKK